MPLVQEQRCLFWRRREPLDAGDWVRGYARRRYGPQTGPSAEVAWAKLGSSVYNAKDGHTDHSRDIPTSRPGLSPAEVGLWGLKPHLWYDARQVELFAPLCPAKLALAVTNVAGSIINSMRLSVLGK